MSLLHSDEFKANPYLWTSERRRMPLYLNSVDDVPSLAVIGLSLSNLCRWTGHVKRFFSVAQHSVLVSYMVPPEFALTGLLHDAAECLSGDIATPVKQQIMSPALKRMVVQFETLLGQREGIQLHPLPAIVKEADSFCCRLEARCLMRLEGDEIIDHFGSIWSPQNDKELAMLVRIPQQGTNFAPLEPREARRAWAYRLWELQQ